MSTTTSNDVFVVDGKPYLYLRESEFTCTVRSFKERARRYARAHDLEVSARPVDRVRLEPVPIDKATGLVVTFRPTAPATNS